MKIRILLCDAIHEDGIKKMKNAGFDVDIRLGISKTRLKKIVSAYDALIVRSRTKVSRDIIEAGKNLKTICRAGVGVDNIDVKAAGEREIKVLTVTEASSDAVAELTIWMILSLARRASFAERELKEGRWIKNDLTGWQLKGKNLGIIGLGQIGERVARIGRAFGARIVVTKRTPPKPELLRELEAEYIPLTNFSKFLQKSDVISIHVPLTPETHHLIDTKEIQQMKEGAFLVNTSRGGIVNEDALKNALISRKLGGIALDVYSVEPPQCLDLIQLGNVVCTPHIGSNTHESQRKLSILTASKLIGALKSRNNESKSRR